MEWTVCVCIVGHAYTSWHSHVLGRNSHEKARRNRNWSQQLLSVIYKCACMSGRSAHNAAEVTNFVL